MKKFFKMFGAAGLLAGMMMLGGCGGDSSVPYGSSGFGYVVKGPVAGATVTYSSGAKVTSSTVDGSFIYNGLAVTTSGGTYTDLAGVTTRKAPPMAGLAYKANVTPLTTIYAAATASDQAKLQTLIGGVTNSIDYATLGGKNITTANGNNALLIARLNETIGEILTLATERSLTITPAFLANVATVVANTTSANALLDGNYVVYNADGTLKTAGTEFNADGTLKTAGTGLYGMAANILAATGSPFVVDATYTTLGAMRAYISGLACTMGAKATEGKLIPLPNTTATTYGYVVKGPVGSATVTYSDNTTTTTTSTGRYSYKGLAVTTTGGTYVDVSGVTRNAPNMATPAGKANVTPLTTIFANASAADQTALLTLLAAGGVTSIDSYVTGTVTGTANVFLEKLNETIGEVLTQCKELGVPATATYLAGIANKVGALSYTTIVGTGGGAILSTAVVTATGTTLSTAQQTTVGTKATTVSNSIVEGKVVPTGSTGSTGGNIVN